MKTYETVTIVKPQLSDNEVAAFVDTAKEFISKAGGEVVSEEKLGRRRLSHDINKNREGFYLYLKFKANADFNKNWAKTMKLNPLVLRTMIVSAIEPKNKPAKKAKKVATPVAA